MKSQSRFKNTGRSLVRAAAYHIAHWSKDPEERYQSVHDLLIDLRTRKEETTRVSRAQIPSQTAAKEREIISEEQRVEPTDRGHKKLLKAGW